MEGYVEKSSFVKFALVGLDDGMRVSFCSNGFVEFFGGGGVGHELSSMLTTSELEYLTRMIASQPSGKMRVEDRTSKIPYWLGFEVEEGAEHVLLSVGERAEINIASVESVNSKEMMRQILDLLPSPVFVKDRYHRWILANDRFDELIGADEPLLGKSDYDFLPKEQADHFWAMDEIVMSEGRESIVEEPITTPSGEQKWVLTHKIPLELEEGGQGLLGVVTDITRRKLYENQMLWNTQMRDRAIRSNQTKSKFMANMSHELRTPLNAIIGYSELLLEELDGDELDLREDVQRILKAAHMLLDLINEVLDLSRIEAGKLLFAPDHITAQELIDQINVLIDPLLHGRGVSFEVDLPDEPVELFIDPKRLKQVVLNLCTNAVKFTHSGTITLRVERDGDDVLIEVRDTGVGIPEERFADLFVAFERLEAKTSTVQGTGLGLTLARYLCRMMGGDVSVRSEVGVGSVFTVRLPQRVESLEEIVQESDDVKSPEVTLHHDDAILVIDDDHATYELFKRFSSAYDVQVFWAPDAALGLQYARQYKPSLIILDIVLPDRSGWDVLEALREQEELAGSKVVVVSFIDEVEGDRAARAERVLQKPVSKTQWTELLDHLGM